MHVFASCHEWPREDVGCVWMLGDARACEQHLLERAHVHRQWGERVGLRRQRCGEHSSHGCDRVERASASVAQAMRGRRACVGLGHTDPMAMHCHPPNGMHCHAPTQWLALHAARLPRMHQQFSQLARECCVIVACRPRTALHDMKT
jgi:hypothetical protein